MSHPSNSDAYQGGRLLENLLLFGRLCKRLGMEVTPNRMAEAARALAFIDLGHRDDFYYALRALIVTRQRDLPPFDRAFGAFWRPPLGLRPILNVPPQAPQRRRVRTLPPSDAPTADGDGQTEDSRLVALIRTQSADEILRRKDFADMTPDEIAAAKQMMQRLPWSLGARRTRRYTAGNGAALDIRRAFRRSLRTGGEVFALPTRTRRVRPRPLVVLCDISGSMERYTRLLLHFLHTLAGSAYRVESFVFSTRLIRITRPLRHKSVDRALREIGTDVNVWGSGTRIGEALHGFNYRWGRRVLGRGAIVLLITDGWDRGDAAQLEAEIARLQRSCYRLVWLNPLLGDAEYEPLTLGARALLPFVDDFLPVHNLASLETLARELQRVDWHRPTRSRHAHEGTKA